MYQKWPDQIFPIVNFVFSHYDHFGLGRGGGGFGGGVPPPWFLIILKKPWVGGGGCLPGAHQTGAQCATFEQLSPTLVPEAGPQPGYGFAIITHSGKNTFHSETGF